MHREQFRRLVARALAGLPPEFRRMLHNVAVVVKDEPSAEDLAEAGLGPQDILFGFYRGIPLTERTSQYGLVPPDTIIIYQGSIEAACGSAPEMVDEIRRTVIHEVAHYFGLTDEKLAELGWD